ncbi:hypothetical protein ACIGO6_28660 [Streptomyces sp. NPDC053750]|uniref:hypothetical protein n=1 Tax=Streptomyces sp. NPDC053750 TaxID=3365714 RepID=UPI0037D20019
MAKGQEQAAPDAVLTRIGQVVMLHHAGDREEARHRFLGLWAEIGEHGDPLHRCTLAHYLADTQDDPEDELAWDLRALSAAQELARELAEDRPADRHEGALAARALYPSLHLNLAADYERLGHREAARLHLRRARGAAESLARDRYGEGVRAAIGRLELRLGGAGPDGSGGAGGPGGSGGPVGPWGPPRQQRP